MGSARKHKGSTIRKQPFIEHVRELQVRLTWVCATLAATSFLAYGFNETLLSIIQKPLNQTLYYTSPVGGLSFILKLCLTIGFILSLPAIVYHVVSFIRPLISRIKTSTIVLFSTWSFGLALIGVAFAYFISLPAALRFLATFGGNNIQSLITANEYFNFALAYLTGFAILFQIPLIVLIVNRITPLKPSHMMRAQPYILLFSFIAAAIITPTPDPVNQLLMAAPMVLMYQIGIALAWITNITRRKLNRKPAVVAQSSRSQQVIERQPQAQPPVQQTPLRAPSQPRQRHRQFDFVALPVRPIALQAPDRPPMTTRQPIAVPTRKFMDVMPPSRA